ncbi:MAG: hypothetical protein KAQ72_09930 [Desulfobacula sp.]|nr:hypothetical protein [Desulfobacula sp.]
MKNIFTGILSVLILFMFCENIPANSETSKSLNPWAVAGTTITSKNKTFQKKEPRIKKTRSKSLIIPGISFISSSHSRGYAFNKDDLTGCTGAREGKPHNFFVPVSLPENVTITSLEMRCYDGKGKGSIHLKLKRRPMYNKDYTKEIQQMALLKSVTKIKNYFDVVKTLKIKYPKIDNSNYGYYLEAIFTDFYKYSHLRLGMVKINFICPD